MTDNNKMAYDRAGGRVQQSLAGRVRNAEERLRRLLADPVPPPPQPLQFRAVPTGGRAHGVVLDAADIAVDGRLSPTSVRVSAGERLLSLGLFTRAQLTSRVENLSTGQRQRLELARLVSEPSELLLLDEPTNHLSPGLVEELETALADYRGALVVVSHDRRLRDRWRGVRLDMRAPASA